MSYNYEQRTGRLMCDRCGRPGGGTRRRACPHHVLGPSTRTNGRDRELLPYCPPPALCGDCVAALGGREAVHERCRIQAAHAQAAADAIERRLDAGESLSVEAYGAEEPGVPAGMVGVKFVGRTGVTYRLMAAADYSNDTIALSAARCEPWPEREVQHAVLL
jgi:hypothetical protein